MPETTVYEDASGPELGRDWDRAPEAVCVASVSVTMESRPCSGCGTALSAPATDVPKCPTVPATRAVGGPIRSLLRPDPAPGWPGVTATPHLKATPLKVTRRTAALILAEDLRQLTRRRCSPNQPRRKTHWDQWLSRAVRPPV